MNFERNSFFPIFRRWSRFNLVLYECKIKKSKNYIIFIKILMKKKKPNQMFYHNIKRILIKNYFNSYS